MIHTLVCRLLDIYLAVVFARIVLSWFPLEPGSMFASIFGFLYAVTEPILAPLRRVIPPMGGSGMALDLSPTIVIFGLFILRGIIC